MKFLEKFWYKNKEEVTQETPKKTDKKQTYIDMIISLNVDKQIDFSLFIDDQIQTLSIDPVEYIKLCSDFLSVVLSDQTKADAIQILDSQIKNSNNEVFIQSLIELVKIKQPQQSKSISKNTSFIKPSEVFARYTV